MRVLKNQMNSLRDTSAKWSKIKRKWKSSPVSYVNVSNRFCHRFHLMIRGNCSPDARAARFNSTLMPLQIVTISNIITEVEQLIRNRFTR